MFSGWLVDTIFKSWSIRPKVSFAYILYQSASGKPGMRGYFHLFVRTREYLMASWSFGRWFFWVFPLYHSLRPREVLQSFFSLALLKPGVSMWKEKERDRLMFTESYYTLGIELAFLYMWSHFMLPATLQGRWFYPLHTPEYLDALIGQDVYSELLSQ